MIEEIIYVLKMLFAAYLTVQWTSIFLFFIGEWFMVDYYEYGTFENPKNTFDKVINFGMAFLMGSGYYWYRRFSKQKWIIRKMNMFIFLVLQGIISIITFYIVTVPLDLIFS
jgi:hypothetical protein